MAIKLIAVDMDGTFLRTGHKYDKKRFEKLYTEMKKQNIHFVIASGNQYFQLKSFFPEIEAELSFVAENGAFVLLKNKPIFIGDMGIKLVKEVSKTLRAIPDIQFLLCGAKAAYAFKDVDPAFYELSGQYYHRQKQIADVSDIDDQIFKVALHCPIDKTEAYLTELTNTFSGKLTAVSSGHGDIDLIIPGNHKASGLERLGEKLNIMSEEMMAFGDGGNDLEMLLHVGYGFVMENAPAKMKSLTDYRAPHHNENGVLDVIETYLLEGEAGLVKFRK